MASKNRNVKHGGTSLNVSYLYQWVNFENNFSNPIALKRLGGDNVAANRFRGIEDDARKEPKISRWLVAARRENNMWRVTALLKVRPATLEERQILGDHDKYLYLDPDGSGFLALPGEEPIDDVQISDAIKKVVPGNTRGENGVMLPITDEGIRRLQGKIKLSLSARRIQLENVRDSDGAANPTSASLKADVSIIDSDSNFVIDSSDSKAIGDQDHATEEDAYIQTALKLEASNLDNLQRSGLPGKDIDVIAKRRFGQGPFRSLLKAIYGVSCCLSGVTNGRLLIASHIVPWSESSPTQKTDPQNGLLLSVAWDALFDKGFISFNDDGKLLCSDTLDQDTAQRLGLSMAVKLREDMLTEERKVNLSSHRRKHGFDS